MVALQNFYTNSTKVMVDVEGGNNLMYLPLDKLTSPNGSRPAREVKVDSSNLRELTNAVTEQLRRDAAASSNRRGGR